MRKIRNLALAIVATVAVIGGVSACDAGSPAAKAPTAVAPRAVHTSKAGDLNAWATEAAPIITDIGNQSMKLADDPIDQVAGAALTKDATAGLNMQHRSGDKNLDLKWKASMRATQKLAYDVRNYDMNAIVKDGTTASNSMTDLTTALDAAQ